MHPSLRNAPLRAAAVRHTCQLLDANTPLHQSQYMTWLRDEVLAVYQDPGAAIIVDLELSSLGDAIALMRAFEQILGIFDYNHPHLSFAAPAA
jgi:hypothetical protein